MNTRLVELSPDQRPRVGQETCVARHRLHDLQLFDDAALVALLDRHPRDQLIALTMGSDVERPQDNRMAVHDGISGADLLQAVKRGRLWLNVVGVHASDPQYREVIDELYGEIAGQCKGLQPEDPRGTLLISSPDAVVYYHVDGPPSFLWHIRGEKRVWVYPPLHEDLVAREVLEDIFAGARHEYVPYRPAFDAHAEVLDLRPGDVASWPQNAPHRVTNGSMLNVSLSTEHTTVESRRRGRVYCANRFLRRTLNYAPASTEEQGPAALAKCALHRAWKMLGLDDTPIKAHPPAMRVDPSAPLGCVPLLARAASTGSRP